MLINARRCLLFLVPLLYTAAVSAQQRSPITQAAAGRILLDVVVTAKSGPPVSGLQQQDFTLLDNKVPQNISSFQAIDGRQAPIEVILLVDAVNVAYATVAFERDQIDRFLRADAGKLAHPVSLDVLTDTGIQIVTDFSSDGNALSASLDQYAGGLRNFRRGGGFYDAAELFQISLEGLHTLAAREAPRPGRKIILWISPGWPLLSGPSVQLDGKEQQRLFGQIVDFSTQFRQGSITLYSVDPLGTADAARNFLWEEFVKGVSKPGQVQPGDLALQVLATQSGGLVINASNDLTALLREGLADTGTYYQISFDPPPGDKPNEYHNLEIHMAKRGLTARTRQGYYSQP